jgi:uncharacterized membrane protein YhaH (DUF805 family)
VKGNVLGFDPETNTGAISGHDGQRYDFATVDWHEQGRLPRRGDLVDFTPDGRRATQIYPLEAAYVRPSLGAFYFSPRGRISRYQFWVRGLVVIWAIFLLLEVPIWVFAAAGSKAGAGIFAVLLAVYSLVIIWPSLALQIKRIHDRNKSGWLIVIPMIPGLLLGIVWGVAAIEAISSGDFQSDATVGVLIGAGIFTWILVLISLGISIWFFVEFGCLRGTTGENRFGPDPVPHR